MRGSRNFCQFHLVLSLFYSLKRGSNGFIAEKSILILYQGSRGGPLYSGDGVSNFFRGGGGGKGRGKGSLNANFYRKPYTYLLFSRGRVSGPPILLWRVGGVQMLISIETHLRTCYFPGGGCPVPLSSSGYAHGQ